MKNEEKIIKKLIEHDGRFDGLVTKTEFQGFKEEVLNGQEKMITILKRLDEERVFTTEWVRRIEKEVEKQKEEIKKIKFRLKVA